MKHDLTTLFAEPLLDLGNDDAQFRGIFTPLSERAAEKRGVTAQFLENAAEYHQRYANIEHFRTLIDNAVNTLRPIDPRVILDIGSGSGNSVIPLLDLFPEAFVVAADISPQLLAILRDYLETRPEYSGRYALVCMDASNDRYCSGVFDLAVGAAILHHMIEPGLVIRACHNALHAGGAAIFFEPFEIGHSVLSLAYREIVAEADRRGETAPGISMLRHINADYAARQRGNGHPGWFELDDKWMFTRGFFESFGDSGEWAECNVYPIHGGDAPLTAQTRNMLRLMMDADTSALPPWAWDSLALYEASFSPQARHDLIFEGAVVMRTGTDVTVEGTAGSGWWWNPSESGRGFFLEVRDGLACLACCTYTDHGQPTWYASNFAPIRDNGNWIADFRSLQFPLVGGSSEPRSAPANVAPVSMNFEKSRTAQLGLAGNQVPLEPQNLDNPGVSGPSKRSLTGWWIEDAESPKWAALVEVLNNRVFVALLSASDWCIASASRRGVRSYEGEWLLVQGGQTIDGPFRPPSTTQSIGAARLVWLDTNSLVVRLPNGRQSVLARLRFA